MDTNFPAFSVSHNDFGQIQSVSAWRAGWLYEGEAVISEIWSPAFGAQLTGSASFRVVLLTAPARINSNDLSDNRIGVWNPVENVVHPSRARQAAAQGVREQAAIYRTASTASLDDLTRALDRRAAADDEIFAGYLQEAMGSGRFVSADSTVELESDAVFQSSKPAEWLTATGAALLDASYIN
ncbi:MAG: hypothetical protein HQ478_09740 [Chloroflexi bacterium]|nr:hypothetical protein [Chloroflexota bacterium]